MLKLVWKCHPNLPKANISEDILSGSVPLSGMRCDAKVHVGKTSPPCSRNVLFHRNLQCHVLLFVKNQAKVELLPHSNLAYCLTFSHLVCFIKSMHAGSDVPVGSPLLHSSPFLSSSLKSSCPVLERKIGQIASDLLMCWIGETWGAVGLQFSLWSGWMLWSDWVTSLAAVPQNAKNEGED